MTIHYVYRCYDADDRLLYIGCTQDVEGRIGQHQSLHHIGNPASGYLYKHLVRWTSEMYPDKETARDAEIAGIGAEAPLLNVQHNKGRGLRRVPVAPVTFEEMREALNRMTAWVEGESA